MCWGVMYYARLSWPPNMLNYWNTVLTSVVLLRRLGFRITYRTVFGDRIILSTASTCSWTERVSKLTLLAHLLYRMDGFCPISPFTRCWTDYFLHPLYTSTKGLTDTCLYVYRILCAGRSTADSTDSLAGVVTSLTILSLRLVSFVLATPPF